MACTTTAWWDVWCGENERKSLKNTYRHNGLIPTVFDFYTRWDTHPDRGPTPYSDDIAVVNDSLRKNARLPLWQLSGECWFTGAHAFFNGNETYDAISVCLCFLGGKSYAFESCCSLVDGIINCEATLKATSRWETWFSAALGCFPISLLFLVVFSMTVASALKCLFYRLDKRFELQ